MKVGAITVGQAPRVDITPDIFPILGNDIELIEMGALDDITLDELGEIAPEEGDYVLVSRMRDGSQVRFAERKILPRIQRAIEELQERQAECIVMFCTGKFPEKFSSRVPVLYPCDLMKAVVGVLAEESKLAVMIPDESQIRQCRERWERVIPRVTVVNGSPYKGEEEIIRAAKVLRDSAADLIVLDCMGYSRKMKQKVAAITGKPVILPRTLLARIVKEYAETIE